jgi:hypothetical protein
VFAWEAAEHEQALDGLWSKVYALRAALLAVARQPSMNGAAHPETSATAEQALLDLAKLHAAAGTYRATYGPQLLGADPGTDPGDLAALAGWQPDLDPGTTAALAAAVTDLQNCDDGAARRPTRRPRRAPGGLLGRGHATAPTRLTSPGLRSFTKIAATLDLDVTLNTVPYERDANIHQQPHSGGWANALLIGPHLPKPVPVDDDGW